MPHFYNSLIREENSNKAKYYNPDCKDKKLSRKNVRVWQDTVIRQADKQRDKQQNKIRKFVAERICYEIYTNEGGLDI